MSLVFKGKKTVSDILKQTKSVKTDPEILL